MPTVLADRVKTTSSTTGTGSYSLGSAVEGYQNFSVIGNGNTTYYCATNGTDWEIGLGTYSTSGPSLARTTIFASSNSGNAVNWSSGEKEVFSTFPAEFSSGSIPNYTEITSANLPNNQSPAWRSLVDVYSRGVAAGQLFSQPVIQGMLLARDSIGNYQGGTGNAVLTGARRLCIPPLNNYGFADFLDQTNILSTVLLPQTGANFYRGAVISRNGTINFVPLSATRGLRLINGGRIAQTYTLPYTTTSAYVGGVLTNNNRIYFAPFAAARGIYLDEGLNPQSYSLVYTASNGAYSGAVLAANGDVHFIPYNAPVGQKVTPAGVVSTYALPYTSTLKSSGGVMGLDGKIYCAPASGSTTIGQIQVIDAFSGAVSTISIPTNSNGTTPYLGGVLLPNGDIIFTPRTGTVTNVLLIPKVGVPTTIQLPYQYWYPGGGVFSRNGAISLGAHDLVSNSVFLSSFLYTGSSFYNNTGNTPFNGSSSQGI